MSTHNRTLETVDESRGPFNSFQIVVLQIYLCTARFKELQLVLKRVCRICAFRLLEFHYLVLN